MKEGALKNTGVKVVNSPRHIQKEKTIIVIGVARGGTSLVSGSLAHLGVFMGDKSSPPVYEDVLLSNYMESGDLDGLTETIMRYNSIHDSWGFKRPSAIQYLTKIHGHFRNPHFICIFKDLLSIGNRNNISMKLDLLQGMGQALKQYDEILSFVEKHNYPTLLVSYDKALDNKQGFLDSLIDFCSLNVNEEQIESALSFITRDPKQYLEQSQKGKIIGHIDVVTDDSVIGWAAKSADTFPRPLKVLLTVDDKPVGETVASKYRPDLITHKVHKTGKAGFEFKLDETMIQEHSIIRVFEKKTMAELINSPYKRNEKNSMSSE